MKNIPKFPKGLKARIAKQERVAERDKQIATRRKDIDVAKKKLDTLRKKNRGY